MRRQVCLGRADQCVLITRPGTGGDSDPSMAGVNSGYSRLRIGAVEVAPWQQLAVAVDNL
jgi:hypothetical protein